ncbi:hypothetical protein K493DRAFT_203324 [Basidiobolus meristosporus CBS 931.73]|uniref:P-loop containing nucleoside triphosphate hydrolase protein n=1 Tax=Basidiobolus meristosporus CBS 931.73 TaxID=1314790 RepID=A0A1Y1Z8B8_9FUNG|nr:hypothetical protein K493DRAFT_203324 [Basidiobolus meristosporus CBS 931.73]|eukprot:ORY06456.1 hypothetical protein K493DRAFT_203324 [Basidiobolus meristosporus CBS 931.73]
MPTENTLDVIGAGFGRTGTLTMKVALEKLGYPTFHMIEGVMNPSRYAPLWVEVTQGKRPNWDKIFEGFKATVDNPACWWYKDLMKKYPDAKVVLTVRDPEKWYKSCYDTVFTLHKVMNKAIELGSADERALQIADLVNSTVWGPTGCFQGRFEDKEWMIELFKSHIEEVKRVVPADKLLVFEVKEGWEPLCKFLGKPVPDEPFPHVNDTAEMQGRIDEMLNGFPAEIRKQIEEQL